MARFTAVFKNQIDWLPLESGGVRPTQGRTLAVMQVCGGSQSFNVVNALRVLGRWMRMVTIPNQSSVPKAWQEFDEDGRMKPSPLLRPRGRRHGGTVQVHPAGARPQRLPEQTATASARAILRRGAGASLGGWAA